ncbi:MAG TPA: hypothetical protein VFP55_02400 [Solirubrobacteraceae bacterium]|nr:hypothetical protein [Solirubrobacteraceae bacterium]
MAGEPPEWWRGQTPHALPAGRPDAVVISGRVIDFAAEQIPLGAQLLRHVSFEQASCSGLRIVLDELGIRVAWTEFEGCTFTQRRRRLNADGAEPQGSLGNRPSRFSRCTFTGVRLRQRAGFSVGQARFEDCLFEDCRFEELFSYDADYVRCRFVGPIRTAVFFGTSPRTGRRNEIQDNDFTGAAIGEGVSWRAGFPLEAQSWPAAYVPQGFSA